MSAKKYDRDLGIKTTGLREWDNTSLYNRYEATPYRGMEALFQSYRLGRTGRVVDFGCGRGRVVFYIHRRFQVPVVGIEANDKTYMEALENKRRYREKARHIKAPIRLKYGLAEHYVVKPQDSCFYFFNPFSSRVFEKVLRNIAASLEKHPREIDLILYYPLPEYKQAVRKHSFRKINKIRVPGAQDPYGKFVIYRFTPKAG
ncbi:MAG: class I SAM-dependent methyltransferase [Limnochordia bacterium]|nr:class I SAM-dependent methyltransferase [Limnochordia bacterium]MDI9465698.1 class I SAM-dependent methyltransferase [Bacillota bacterium]NLO94513.1 class I SAM-dependent methyltransferase [Bacillota bacterium]HOB41252.1 class I SAM-dependent methyltransferase [Limnochordia bacterium]HOK32842.1 class I SAM-dependent methyltransferase [Limnochordia bacterium]